MYSEDDTDVILNYFVDPTTLEILTGGTVVECGAAEGVYNPSITLEAYYGWSCFEIEPHPQFYNTLCNNRHTSVKINKALTSFTGKADFYMTSHHGNSSLGHSKKHLTELQKYRERWEDGNVTKKIEVETMDWKTFVESWGITKIDLLVLDVEGHELDVVNGMTSFPHVLPTVIRVEYPYSDPNELYLDKEKKQNFSGLIALSKTLGKLGYLFDYVVDENAHFSKKTFWDNRPRPIEWVEESETYVWDDVRCYDRRLFKEFIKQ